MKIIIFGASGLIGQALVSELIQEHAITVAGRSFEKLKRTFPSIKHFLTWKDLTKAHLRDYDIVINLTGENIAAKKWTVEQKKKIIQSRVNATNILAKFCAELGENAPRLFNASAIGIYGLQSTIKLQEQHVYNEYSSLPSCPNDFLAEVGKQWEEALIVAEQNKVQVVKLRFAVVLTPKGGALGKMLPAFKLGLGCTLGSGKQPMSWVSLEDVVKAISFLLQRPEASGAYNIVAPEIVTQNQFAKALASRLNRPCFIKMPALVVKILFGQMGEELLLNGQAVEGLRLAEMGFQFEHKSLTGFLASNLF